MLDYFEEYGIPIWVESFFGHFLYLKCLDGQSSLAQQSLAL